MCVGGSTWTSHCSVCPVSLAGDPLLCVSANTPAIHFLQGSEGAPDLTKLFTHPRPSPRETLSLMFSLLQEINMLGGGQTRRPLQGGLSPFSGQPPGALTADVHKRINKRRFSRVNTGHNQTSRGSTVLRMMSAAHMWINTRLPRVSPRAKLCVCFQEVKPAGGKSTAREYDGLIFKAAGITAKKDGFFVFMCVVCFKPECCKNLRSWSQSRQIDLKPL